MSMWHNKLGEDGQRLTVLSLLPRSGLDRGPPESWGELSLDEAVGDPTHRWRKRRCPGGLERDRPRRRRSRLHL